MIILKKCLLFSILVQSAINDAWSEDPYSELMKKYSFSVEKEKEKTAKNSTPLKGDHSKDKMSKNTTHTQIKKENKDLKSYSIQVASYKNEKEAQEYLSKILPQFQNATLKKVEINNQSWYRVLIGNFPTVHQTKRYLEEFPQLKSQSVIVPNESALMVQAKTEEEPVTRGIASISDAKPLHPKQAESEKAESEKKEIQSPTEQTADQDKKITTPSAPDIAAPKEESENNYGLLGSWMGLKPKLKEHGVDLTLKYKGDFVRNFSGGLKRISDYLGNVDVQSEFDLEKIVGMKNTSLVLYGLGNHGGKPT